MATENPLISIVDSFVRSDRMASEKEALDQFEFLILGLIYGYGQTFKIRKYTDKHGVPYLEPGTVIIPSVVYRTQVGEYLLWVAGEFVNNPNKKDAVNPAKLGLHVQHGNNVSCLEVGYNIAPPGFADLERGIQVLQMMEKLYKKSGIKRAPTGLADYDGI